MEDDQEIFERHAENHRHMRDAERARGRPIDMSEQEFAERRAYVASQASTEYERRRWGLR